VQTCALPIFATFVSSLVLLGCEREDDAPRPAHDRAVAWDAIASEVRALATRHRVAEALELLRARAGEMGEIRSTGERRLREEEGRLLILLARPKEAAEILAKLDAERRVDRTGVLFARALLESGKPPAALERLALLSETSRRSARTDEARALLAADQGDRAAAIIAPVL